MKREYTIHRCKYRAIDIAIKVCSIKLTHLMAYDVMDVIQFIRSAKTKEVAIYNLTKRISSTSELLTILRQIDVELSGRKLIINITYPIEVSSKSILGSMQAIESHFAPYMELMMIPTQSRIIKFWQVKLCVFDE